MVLLTIIMHHGAPVDIRTHLNIVCIKWQIHNNQSMVLVQENKWECFWWKFNFSFFFFQQFDSCSFKYINMWNES